MANLNKVMLIGNLTRDPELRVTPKGTAICQFSLAVNRKFKDESGGEGGEAPRYASPAPRASAPKPAAPAAQENIDEDVPF